ncbi:PhzF family phenazine biosynthesis isomerase [Flavivirga aquimarina]|uniref:PhzF family phenazine biosynthesis isomerase n=1 Tax=Flavivirga aquimarina TaxID=2027862 RepID=A0ABT8WGN3_9FLAO|nr:PhzF family phenazine biosynthesis isomerase [Flavivirga aquimarina]MDO5972313.1 PhzF family phenazine biosynthesis isomerase [Flavivirga aquimarina]
MRLFTVDSFTDTPFKGNPAGVCVLESKLTDDAYIDIAQEINLSETAFVYKEKGTYQLKWFTPTKEVDLCGHATLATAKILFEKYGYADEVIAFETKSGVLTVRKVDGGLEMNFPIGNASVYEGEDKILEAFLNEKPLAIILDNHWCIIELDSDEAVKNLEPNLNLLLSHSKKSFVVTAKSSSKKYDFISRFFGPAIGIDEDPVTGSAHCYLANYWSKKLAKNILIGYQASKRGGIVECEIIDNNRVLLRGNCVIMSELLIEWDI